MDLIFQKSIIIGIYQLTIFELYKVMRTIAREIWRCNNRVQGINANLGWFMYKFKRSQSQGSVETQHRNFCGCTIPGISDLEEN